MHISLVGASWGDKWAERVDLSCDEDDEGDEADDEDDDADEECTKPWRNGRPKRARDARIIEERERNQSAGGNEDEIEDEDIDFGPSLFTEEEGVHW